MRCLTVQQPWAWAIVEGGKGIENRTQMWSYRGKLAIHAGVRASERGLHDPRILDALASNPLNSGGFWSMLAIDILPRLAFGAIIGVADLVDVHPDAGCCRPWGESAYVERGGRERRHIAHLVLENPQPLAEPIACRGALGLWTPPADIGHILDAAHSAEAQPAGSLIDDSDIPGGGSPGSSLGFSRDTLNVMFNRLFQHDAAARPKA